MQNTTKVTRRGGKRTKPRQQKRKTLNASAMQGSTVTDPNQFQRLPNQVGLILPDRYRTNLKFSSGYNLNLTATTNASVRFRPTGLFDVDPLVGGTSLSGFTELAAIYSHYRVLSSKIVVRVSNASTSDFVIVRIAPLNADPGASPAPGVFLSLSEQPYCKTGICSLSGSPGLVIRNNMTTEKIYGSRSVLFDDNFESLTTTVPNNNWYWIVAASALRVIAQNVDFWMEITCDVEFYGRNFLTN
jgi:hypothetical protein